MKPAFKTTTTVILCSLLCLPCPSLVAQQNSRINPRVEVQRDYEVRMMEILKPKLSATIPDSISKFNITMDYTIFDKPYHDLYSFKPLPSILLSTPKPHRQPWIFVRLGVTMPTSPEADFFIQAPLSGMSALMLTAQHASFRGELPRFKQVEKTVADQMYNKIDARYSLNWEKGCFEIGGGCNFNYSTYYGVTGSFPLPNLNVRTFMHDSLSHSWAIYKADLSLSSHKSIRPGTEWNFSFGWRLLEDQARLWQIAPLPTLRENLIRFEGGAGFRFDPNQLLGFTLNGSFSNHLHSKEIDRGIYTLHPYYQLNKNRFYLHAGVLFSGILNQGTESDKTNKIFFYPKIEVSYEVIPKNLLLYTHIGGENRHNNYQSLLAENPWLSHHLSLNNSDIPWDIRAGLKGKGFNHFGYHLYGQFLKTNNQYYFYNTFFPTNDDLLFSYPAMYSLFALEYDDEQRLSAVAELSWNTTPLALHLTGKYHSYTLRSGNSPRFTPNIEAQFSARYQWRERIIATANITYRGEVFATSIFNPIGANRIKIDDFTNIDLTLEYRFASWFGIYAKTTNLLHAEKQYYLYYYEPGLRIGGGVTFRF
jgi:hypothetical protein